MGHADPESHDLHPTGGGPGTPSKDKEEQEHHLGAGRPADPVSVAARPGGVAEATAGAQGDHVE